MGCNCDSTSSLPLSYPFQIAAGATFQATIFWQLQDTPTDAPAAVDLTGYTAYMIAVRNSSNCCSTTPQTPLFTLTTENGGITLGATNGRMDFLILASVTAGYQAGGYVYNLDLTAPDGITITRLLSGIVNVSPAVVAST